MPGGGIGGGGAGFDFDFSAVIQAALVGFVFLAAAAAALRRAASRYFVVDAAGFAAAYEDHHHIAPAYAMPPQGDQQQPQQPPSPQGQLQAAAPELGPCAQCGAAGTKKCSGCKRMRYWCVPPSLPCPRPSPSLFLRMA